MATVMRVSPAGRVVDRRGLLASLIPGAGDMRSPSASSGWRRPLRTGTWTSPADNGVPPAHPMDALRPRLRHLFRRAGFGATKADLDRFQAEGYDAAVSWLLSYESAPDPVDERLALMEFDFTKKEEYKRWWLVRMRYTERPLQEKMALFLHGLVSSALNKVEGSLMFQQNQLLRSHALGSYRDLLVAVSTDPAMLVWLDGRNSRKQRPNENFPRELMELFTLGLGHYTEQDVQQAARAFTGWTVPKDSLEAAFNRGAHDVGMKTFMGQTGTFNGAQIIDIILSQRAAAEHLARRLWTHFVYPDPEPEAIAPLAGVLETTGYSLRAAVEYILRSDAFVSPRAYRSIVRGPVDLVIGTLRTLELDTDGKDITSLVRAMGQDVMNPPNVAGWPGGAAWINASTWLQRMNFANAIASRRSAEPGRTVDMAGLPHREGITEAGGVREYLLDFLLDGALEPERRAAIDAYLAGGEALEMTARSLNRKGRGLLYLLLASPEYQLM